jgi:dolichol kinase
MKEAPTDLGTLVRRTEGVQPWRRAFHATNGVLFAIALSWWPFAPGSAWIAAWAVALTLLVGDLVRLRIPQANEIFFRLFRRLASPREAEGLASSTWYAIGVAAAITFAPPPVAVSGILVLAFSDPAASYFGQRWGRRPFLGGSVEGSLLFFMVTVAVLVPRHGWAVALAVALPVTLLERRSWPLDDNFTVPVATAAIVVLLAA